MTNNIPTTFCSVINGEVVSVSFDIDRGNVVFMTEKKKKIIKLSFKQLLFIMKSWREYRVIMSEDDDED